MTYLDDIRELAVEGRSPEEIAEELEMDPIAVAGLIESLRLDRPLLDSDFHNK